MSHNDGTKDINPGDGPRAMDAERSKVAFTAEQQAKVQELIDDAYRKAYSKALKTRGAGEDVEALKTEVEKLKGERKMASLYRAISRYNVVDAEEVAKLVSESVVVSEGGDLTVMNGSGSVRVSGAGRPLSVDEYLAEWLNERPHHLRASGSAGAGSRGALFGANGPLRRNLSDPTAWKSMPREELERLLEEGIDVHGSAGQVYRFKDVKNPFHEARRRRFRSSSSGPSA